MHPTASLLGELTGRLLGGLLWGYLFGLLVGLAFRRLEPDGRAAAATIGAGLILAGIVALTQGLAPAILYIPGLVIAYFVLRRRYRKLWSDQSEVAEVFD